MKMKQIQQQIKGKMDSDKVITLIVIGLIVLVVVCAYVNRQTPLKEDWVDYKEWKEEDKYKEVHRAISKRRRERNLARQHGRDLKTIFDYVDR